MDITDGHKARSFMEWLKAFIHQRISSPGLSPDDGMRYWQERFVSVFVFAGTVLGFIVYVPSLMLSIKEGLWSVAVADTVLYAWTVILFVCISIPFWIRAVTVSLVAYVLGMILLLTIGPFGGGPVWLFAFPVVVALLLGLRMSLVSLAINAGTLVFIGLLLHTGFMNWDYSTTNPLYKWIVIGLNFMLLNVIVTITVALISGGLQDLLKRQKSMLAAVEESEERFRILFESAPDAYYINDLDGNFIDGNKAAQELIGYPREELTGKSFLAAGLLPPDQIPKAAALVQTNLEGKPAGPEEIVLSRKGGDTVVTEIIAIPTKIKDQHVVLGIARDISERKRLETQLQKAQKMEAVGTLAGGVAHDLNNVLAGLVSYPELVLMDMPKDSPYRKHILRIQKSGEKAAAIVQDLLTLARRGVVVKEVVNLNDVISEYLNSPEYDHLRSLHPDVHVRTRFEKEVPNILGSPTHLFKSIMNLLNNAAEAMPDGGNIHMVTEHQYIHHPINRGTGMKKGDYVVLTVSDNGLGIPPADIDHIFEPFYTKKEMGRSGTGLGMAVVWGTVRDHEGHIDVQSTEGTSSTFTLYFPADHSPVHEAESPSSRQTLTGHGETILVVDDMADQRQVADGMLKQLGYSVATASSGPVAVEYVRHHRVDLLILDMLMTPDMDGLDTYRKILEIRPNQKAIVASGFSETDRVKTVQALGAGAYIKKPFLLKTLGEAVKAELQK